MPKTSLAGTVTDWEKLLKNVSDTVAELPDLTVYSTVLDQMLGKAKDGLALAAARIGIKQQETQDRQKLMKEGRDAASKLRLALKAHFGPKSERLLQYGIGPLRAKRKKADKEKPKPADPAPASHSEPTPQVT
jgi:hypothetical protein